MLSPDPQPSDLAFAWQTHWTSFVAVVVQVVVLVWYLRSTRRLAALGRCWSILRTGSFVAGILVTAYAVEGGIAYYQQRNFTTHVVQLLLLIDVAPPFLAMGAPLTLALQSSPRRVSAVLFGALHSRTVRAFSSPLAAVVLSMGTMYVYFLTPLYRLSEEHPVFLAYVHLQFFLVGCCLWWLVVGRDASARHLGVGMRFVLVLVQIPCDAALGLVVAMATKPFYPAGNTLADTQTGGNVLLGLTEVLVVAVLALLFAEWAREEERKAIAADRQLDAALAAARAVAGSQQPDSGQPEPDQSDIEAAVAGPPGTGSELEG
jgi:cytochrome c oxidase assembly factor CtaG